LHSGPDRDLSAGKTGDSFALFASINFLLLLVMKYLLIVVYCLYLRGYEKRLIGIKENVMKKFLLLSVLLAFGIATVAEAQLREDLSKSRDYTGAVFQTQQPTTSALGNFLNNINMEMSHSYSMNSAVLAVSSKT
jgi:hypothetical protein